MHIYLFTIPSNFALTFSPNIDSDTIFSASRVSSLFIVTANHNYEI